MSKLNSFKITQDEYRKMDGLSSSDIKILLENPYCFIHKIPQEKTKSLSLGSLVHSLVLEIDEIEKRYVIVPRELNKREKEYKEIASIAQSEQKELIEYSMWLQARNIAASLSRTNVFNLIQKSVKEMSFTREIDDVLFKCRPDSYLEKEGIIFDLKTTSLKNGASASEFLKNVANYKYYIQAALYLSVLQAKEFYFVVIETNAPYMIGVYKLDAQSLEFGNDKIKEAVEVFNNLNAYKKNHYLGKERELVQTLTLPNWVYYQ